MTKTYLLWPVETDIISTTAKGAYLTLLPRLATAEFIVFFLRSSAHHNINFQTNLGGYNSQHLQRLFTSAVSIFHIFIRKLFFNIGFQKSSLRFYRY